MKRAASQDGFEEDDSERTPVPECGFPARPGPSEFASLAITQEPTFQDTATPWEFSGTGVNPLFFDPSIDFQDVPNDLDWFFQDVLQKTPSAASDHEAATDSMNMFPYLQQDLNLTFDTLTSPWVNVSAILRSSLEGLSPDLLNSPFFGPSNLAKCYELYFNNYHPHFPFLHRPSLVPIDMPPLLLVAIIALGATLSEDLVNFEIATRIHDDLRFRMCRVCISAPLFLKSLLHLNA